MGRVRAECPRHRAALTAFAAHREPGPGTRRALDHVDRCRACAGELQEFALAVIALRRLGELPERAAIDAAAWPRLRVRIECTRAKAAALAWHRRTTLAGMAAATLVVAAVVAPLALHIPLGAAGIEPVGYNAVELDLISRQVEQRYLFEARIGTLAPSSGTGSPSTVGSDAAIPKRYPDGIARQAKEVEVRTTVRPPIVD